jgi:hypothetical protein
MSEIDFTPIKNQIEGIDKAAYRVVYNLLSKTYNIEKQYLGFKLEMESSSFLVDGNYRFKIRKKNYTVLKDTIIRNYERIKDNLFDLLKNTITKKINDEMKNQELIKIVNLTFKKIITELKEDFESTYPNTDRLELRKGGKGKTSKRGQIKGKKTRRNNKKR